MRALANQILDSFSDIVQLILVVAALVFYVVMCLLTKTVLGHSARSISHMKVFGLAPPPPAAPSLGVYRFP
jgi:L-cystine uptake protein TcyP (sodium:dicarboxylate symporter family)